jgi:hypothetical protein
LHNAVLLQAADRTLGCGEGGLQLTGRVSDGEKGIGSQEIYDSQWRVGRLSCQFALPLF